MPAQHLSYLVKIPCDGGGSAREFEQVFLQLHETLAGTTASFEYFAHSQVISILFSAPFAASETIAGQIYAVAPTASIELSEDPTRLFQSSVSSQEVSLFRPDIFPIKYPEDFRSDSLSALFNLLSQAGPDEQVMVQIVFRPQVDSFGHQLRLSWRRRFDRLRNVFRFKYWIKREVAKTFGGKILEKSQDRLFRCNIRFACAHTQNPAKAQGRLASLVGAFSNFNTLDLNRLRFSKIREGRHLPYFEQRRLHRPFLLSHRELASFFHLPSEKEVPNVVRVLAKQEPPPRQLPSDTRNAAIAFFGATNFRGQNAPFGFLAEDRRRHTYVVGKSGCGKSKLLELLIANDVRQGKGVGVLDPHGDLVDAVLRRIPKSRVKDVVLFDPADLAYPPRFNPLEQVPEELKMRVTIGFLEVFKKVFGTHWTPRLEHVLRYTTLALLDSPDSTILSIPRMLSDKNYRQDVVRNIKESSVRNFWMNEFSSWSERYDSEAITPLINKVGQLVSTNMLRNILGQADNAFDFRQFMDSRKIVLCKVSKGILGEENASLLGAMIVTKMYQAAMSRADIAEEKREDFFFYVDEFHNFATDTFGEILSEARKYRLNLTLAHQFLGQLSPHIRKTVFGNVGNLLSFRLGGEDADTMAKEFAPRFSARDIIHLGVRQFCIKMSIGGETREAFSASTLDVPPPREDLSNEIKESCRSQYCRPMELVSQIMKSSEAGFRPAQSTEAKTRKRAPSEFREPIL